MSRWELETFRARPRPMVLIIGCSPDLAARCHAAAALLGAVVREADQIGAAVTIATQHAPLAIVIPTSLCEKYPDEFKTLAGEVAATLVQVPGDEISQLDLEKLLYDAVAAATVRRGADPV